MSKWLLPFKRYRKNYENIGCFPWALQHDIGFSGRAMYRPVRFDKGGITVMDSQMAQTEYDTYSRKSTIQAVRTLAGTTNA